MPNGACTSQRLSGHRHEHRRSRRQRFFLNWGTVWRRNFTPEEQKVRLQSGEHALANFRAIVAPSNLPSFAAAFSCKPGQPMVRESDKQVVIW
jgi:putative endopeptidase